MATDPKTGFLEQIATASRELSRPLLEDACVRLERLPAAPTLEQRLAAIASVPAESARQQLAWLVTMWTESAADVSPSALALALRAGSAVDDWHRAAQMLEVVWTGPAPLGTTLRRTDQALLELIGGASRRIIVVAYAAYKVEEIRKALFAARDRGVELWFILESVEESGGKLRFDPLPALGELAQGSSVFVWPQDLRERDEEGGYGLLHVKCAVADGRSLIVSSANFTGSAMELNMELGLLVRGGDLATKVERHFENLVAEGVLVRA